MKICILELNKNLELYNYLKYKYIIVDENRFKEANVILINKIYNINFAFQIVDYALNKGIDIICIKNNFGKEYYVCNNLIKNGAAYI